MKFIIGKKQEMTQIWRGEEAVAVTKVSVGPCIATQVKNVDKDGYSAVQFGYGTRKEKNIKKPQRGHMKDLGNFECLKEFRIEDMEFARGDKIDVSSFASGDKIQVSGISKGKGFQGVVKRHGFQGAIQTHGTKDQVRMPGSIGAKGPAHVFKGMKMGGHMGNAMVTTKNLEVIEVDVPNNILYIKGAVPGAKNGLVFVQGEGEIKIIKTEEKKDEPQEIKPEDKKEEKIEEKIEKKTEENSVV
ncbi:MAG: 50S ribosomal protein L3 [bacterium]